MSSKAKLPISFIALTLALGCTPAPEAREPTVSAYRQSELESERTEFIDEAQAELREIDAKIAHLQTRLQHEAKHVSEEERAEWSQALFELQRDRARIESELARAREVTPEEWEQMRGDFAVGIDTLQAAMTKVGDDIARAFSDEAGPELRDTVRADTGLCAIDVRGADADVAVENGRVAVTVTADERADVAQLQRKAKLASPSAYTPATAEHAQPSTVAAIPVHTTTEPIEDGVKVSLKPVDVEQFETLRETVERDASYLGTGACAQHPVRTGMR